MVATASSFKYDAILEAKGNFTDSYIHSQEAGEKLKTSLQLNGQNTMRDFAGATGLKGAEIDNYLAQNFVADGETIDSFFMRIREEPNKAISPERFKGIWGYKLAKQFVKNYYNTCIREIAPQNKSTFEKYYAIENYKVSEAKKNGITEWLAPGGEGRRLLNQLSTARSRGMISDLNKKYYPSTERSYDQYILRHSGYKVTHKDISKAPDILANALAASILKKNGKEFSVDAIHKAAKRVKRMSEFKEIIQNPVRLVSCLADPAAVELTRKRMLERTFKVDPENVASYVKRMKKLYKNIQPTGRMSTEYSNFKAAVEEIAKLDKKYDFETVEGRRKASKDTVKLNIDLFAACEKYMTGKEKVRGSLEGQMRFNNNLDALSLMVQFSPKMTRQVVTIVNNINKVRNLKSSDPNYVRLYDYGDKRAARAITKKNKVEIDMGIKQVKTVTKDN